VQKGSSGVWEKLIHEEKKQKAKNLLTLSDKETFDAFRPVSQAFCYKKEDNLP
jgi:hypothetical protein